MKDDDINRIPDVYDIVASCAFVVFQACFGLLIVFMFAYAIWLILF